MWLLRKIEDKDRWRYDDPDFHPPWISTESGEIPADPLQDLNTKNNQLSVYMLNEVRAELVDRILTALAATRNNSQKIECLIIPEEIIKYLNLELKRGKGGTPDGFVNELHCDIVQLTANKLVELAKAVIGCKAESDRRTGDQIRDLLIKGVQEGRLEQSKINPDLKKRLLHN